MPDWVKGLLTCLIATSHGILYGYLLNLALDEPLDASVAMLLGGGFLFLYGLEAGLLVSYNLKGIGWLQLLIDMTWSLPNTIWGFVLGNLIFIWFGNPSREKSRDRG